MDFVQSLGDTSNVPEFNIGGVARAEIIDNCILRITLYKPPVNGEQEHVPACQLSWTIPAWCASRPMWQELETEIARVGLAPRVHEVPGATARHH